MGMMNWVGHLLGRAEMRGIRSQQNPPNSHLVDYTLMDLVRLDVYNFVLLGPWTPWKELLQLLRMAKDQLLRAQPAFIGVDNAPERLISGWSVSKPCIARVHHEI
jgi:hypothetical protein